MSTPSIDSGFRCLAAAVIGQAYNDIEASDKSVSPATRANAEWFFKGGYFQMFADMAGISNDAVLGKYREALAAKGTKRRRRKYASVQS